MAIATLLYRSPIKVDLPDLAAAKCEAVRHLRRLLNSEAGHGVVNTNRSIEITDRDGTRLAVVTYADAIGLCAIVEK